MASTGIIIAIILIILLLGAGVTFLILYLVEKNKKKTISPAVGINDPKFTVKSNIEVEASWSSTDPNNQVTLYASTKPITIGSDGKPVTAEGVSNSNTVDGNTVKSVNISGLTSETTYYLALVAFNETSFTINTIVYTDIVLDGEFRIKDLVSGDSFIILATNETAVNLEKVDSKSTLNDVWEFDPRQSVIFNKGISDNPEIVLYNNGGTLAAESIETLTSANKLALAQWEYSDNKWCLQTDKDTCMIREITTPTKIKVGKSVTPNDNTWKNIKIP